MVRVLGEVISICSAEGKEGKFQRVALEKVAGFYPQLPLLGQIIQVGTCSCRAQNLLWIGEREGEVPKTKVSRFSPLTQY